MKSGVSKVVAAVISGLLVAGLFVPFSFSALAWAALMPLLWALWSLQGRRAGWKGFGIGYIGGAVSCLIQFQWLGSVSWLGVVILSLYLALYWGLFGVFAAKFRPQGNGPGAVLQTAFCHGAVWAGLELLRGWLFTGFSWNPLGVAFHETRTMAQGADLLGVGGLSLMLVFFQAVLLQSFGKWRENRVPLGVAALLVVSLFFYGKFRIAGESQVESIRLRTLLVQLNIPQEAARMLWTDLETHQGYEDETLKALESLKSPDGKISEKWPDWVMWPEVALTGRLLFTDSGARGIPENNRETLAQIRTAGEFTLIYGAGELEGEPAGEYLAYKEKGRSYNSMAVVPPDDSLQTYRKHHLVIFGETIPFVDSLPFLKEIYKQQSGAEYTGSFNAGDSLEPLPILVGERKISAIPSICFEDSVARLTRKFVRPEPQVIVNITNDGWFKQTAGAAQHFSNSRFRAIELRRPMLRCANTGISAAVDSTGSTAHPETGAPQIIVDQNGSHFTRGSLLAEIKIPLKPSFSLFALIGDWGLIFTGIAGLTMAIFTRKSE